MLKTIYYPLKKAALMLDISPDELIYHAKVGRFRVVIPKPEKPCFIVETINYDTSKRTTEFKNDDWMMLLYMTRCKIDGDINYGSDHPQHSWLGVHKVSLDELECNFLEQDLILYVHRLDDGRYSELVKLRNPCTDAPLKLKDANLCILNDDIERFKQTLKPWLIPDDRDKTPAKEDWHIAARYFYRLHKKANPNFLKKEVVKLVLNDLADNELYKRGGKDSPSEGAIEKILQNIEI